MPQLSNIGDAHVHVRLHDGDDVHAHDGDDAHAHLHHRHHHRRDRDDGVHAPHPRHDDGGAHAHRAVHSASLI